MSTNALGAVMQTIGYPRDGSFVQRCPQETEAALQLAKDNKVESLYLQALVETDSLSKFGERHTQKQQYQQDVRETCERLVDTLDGAVSYALVKSIHPFPADASDVDVAVFDVNNLEELPIVFEKHGYKVLGTAPSAATVEDTETGQLVDFQSFFGLHKVVYYNHSELMKNIGSADYTDSSFPVPERPYDLSLIINHSVTELMFLLKEYYSMVHFLETEPKAAVQEFIHDIRLNSAEPGCQAFLGVVDALSEEYFSIQPSHMELLEREIGVSQREGRRILQKSTVPYRYSRQTLTRFTLQKFRERQFRRSFMRQLPSFANPRTAGYILKKVYGRQSRDTY